MSGAPPSVWQEAKAADGRVYYYNTQTNATQWTKPRDLMTATERALENTPWKEYTAENGRKYWHNSQTQETTWNMPEDIRGAVAAAEASQNQAPQFVAGGGSSAAPWTQPRERERDRDRDRNREFDRDRDRDEQFERAGPERQIGYRDEARAAPTFVKSDDPNYNTYEEAEAAFMKMLKKCNVQADWTWDQTMRTTIKDPQYRSIRDPRDRKAAFEKFIVEQRAQEREKEKDRLTKLRADFGLMLRRHPEIKHYTRWKTAKPIVEHETIFRSTDDDNERRQLFHEYIVELQNAHLEREAQVKKSAMDELQSILKGLDLEPYTRWGEAQPMIQDNERFASEDKFKTLSKSDVLTAFENHIKTLERHFNDQRQREKNSKARTERKHRDDFIDLLRELKSQGKIVAGTKWMQIHPVIENDARFTKILAQPGSTPMELFWDVLEDEERALRSIRNEVYDILEDKHFEVTPRTPYEEYVEAVSSDRRSRNIPKEQLKIVYNRIQEKVKRREEEAKNATERLTRKTIDSLRSHIKHLEDPPVRATTTWEEVKPRIERYDDYTALDEDQRKQAFDKVIRRLKEKDEDAERRREHRDHDRAKDRDRRRAKHSRSPEPEDAYAAERRKAVAERERQYHKSGSTGLSPPPRDRDRDRDRYGDRYRGARDEGRLNGYDRERDRERDRDRDRDRERDRDRDRERDRDRDRDRRRRDPEDDERERLYRLRGEPRGGRDELDYGGGGGPPSAGSRRRRGSDDSLGSRKKARYTSPRRRREDEEKEKEAKKEEVAMHSGSEEGEMVEDE